MRAYVGRDNTGTKRYVSRTVRGTRRDAERELSRLLVEVDEGRFVASPAMTLNDLLERWLEVKRQHVEPSTWSSYEWIARKYIRTALGDRKIGALRPIDLDMLYAELGGRGPSVRSGRPTPPRSPTTRTGRAASMNSPSNSATEMITASMQPSARHGLIRG
ncbi:MAG: N-terminal phage integrase SAM-like domain-containing protein [Acidimicrobiales bacterium]